MDHDHSRPAAFVKTGHPVTAINSNRDRRERILDKIRLHTGSFLYIAAQHFHVTASHIWFLYQSTPSIRELIPDPIPRIAPRWPLFRLPFSIPMAMVMGAETDPTLPSTGRVS